MEEIKDLFLNLLQIELSPEQLDMIIEIINTKTVFIPFHSITESQYKTLKTLSKQLKPYHTIEYNLQVLCPKCKKEHKGYCP